jgi:tRNA-(ms[2]io[6]A)-hydroxylase
MDQRRTSIAWQARVGRAEIPATASDPRWLEVALSDLDAVLADHLHCERKAAQSALSMVRAYPDRPDLVAAIARLAHEETSHVVQVADMIAKRGASGAGGGARFDVGDELAQGLRAHVRKREPARLVDLLLVFALIEARSAERLALLAGALPDAAMARIYKGLASAEVRHRDTFLELARAVAPLDQVEARLIELAAIESSLTAGIPLKPRIH